MPSAHHTSSVPDRHSHSYPEGRVGVSGLLYGGMGLLVSTMMQLLGLFKRPDTRLMTWMSDSLFRGEVPALLVLSVQVLIAALFCFGLAYAVLDSVSTWRRVVLGVTSLVLVLAMVPTFAVWGIYYSPFLPAVGVLWTWFCTMMYVNHHQMPCETLIKKDPLTKNNHG